MIIFQELLLLIILFPLILCRIRKDFNNKDDIITKCNDEPFPSVPLRTLNELGICSTSGYLDTPHNKVNCTKIDVMRDYTFSNYLLDENHRKYRFELVKNLTNNINFIPYNGKLVYITVVSYGYLFFFYNWLCSIKNNIGSQALENTISSLIVLASDDDASIFLKKEGFHVINLNEMVPKDPKYIIHKEAPNSFGENNLALQKGMLFTLASDVVTLGYEFLLFDVDVIMRKDPRHYLSRVGHNIDFLITHDGRFPYNSNVYDIDGPLNSGIIFGKPSCRSKIALETIIANIDLSFKHLRITDQAIINMIVYQSPRFRTLRIGILPWNIFTNGNVFHSKQKFSNIDWNRVIMIHASWTTNWKTKVKKLSMTNDYYYNHNNCSYYNKEFDLLHKYNYTIDTIDRDYDKQVEERK